MSTTIVTQVAKAIQEVLTETAQQAGEASGFVQRESKRNGAGWAQTLVFGWMANPEASLDELAPTAAVCGIAISPQGLDQRFTPVGARGLRQVLEAAIEQVVRSEPQAIPLLERFTGVYIQDSTTIGLPDEVKTIWAGCGGSTPSGAALKLPVRWELRSGPLQGPFLHPGGANDQGAAVQRLAVPAGALRLADLGYGSVAQLAAIGAGGGYWLSRLPAGTAVFTPEGRQWDVIELLQAQTGDRVELDIELSATHRLAGRLLAQRVPSEVSAERRRQLRRAANKQGKPVSRQRLAMADWTILVTNVPVSLLTLAEALVLLRVRWQIELLFKPWKSQGRVDQSRSTKPYRMLCEVYAKLLGLLIQHWVLLTHSWCYPERSLLKAARTVRQHAWELATVLRQGVHLCAVLQRIGRVVAAGCRINKRRGRPSTFQRLQQVVAQEVLA